MKATTSALTLQPMPRLFCGLTQMRTMLHPSPMRLYWSSRSPFVRKAMVAAHETGFAASIDTVRVEVAVTKLNADVMAHNPLNKIPTLVLANGDTLFDSRVICEYLDSLNTGPKLFPSNLSERWIALRRDVIGSGIMENGVAGIGENARPAELRSQPHLAAHKAKIQAALDDLEADAAALARDSFNIGHLSIGCALAYLDFRYADDDWRMGHAKLAAWHKTFSERPSVQQTAHVNVY
jgi:glutathione S-transferase